MSELDRIMEKCTECGLCVKECDFLQSYCKSPKELAEDFRAGSYLEKPEAPYSCNLCNLCEAVCPVGLNVGKMCLELRQLMVREGSAPLPQHQPIIDAQRGYLSDRARLALPDRRAEATTRVFFPGCGLSSYSPELVLKVYSYLQKRLPGTGIALGCCGAPTYLLGEQSGFCEMIQLLEQDVRRLGASEIIVACPFCYYVLKQHLTDLKPLSLYTLLAELEVPGKASDVQVFSIHDPCSSRGEKEVQESVRCLVKSMGHSIEEIDHSRDMAHCCGLGGMAFAVSPEISAAKAERTIREARLDLLTYCANCRENLASNGGRIHHLLDLIFNERWQEAARIPPNDPSVAAENQRLLRTKLVDLDRETALKRAPIDEKEA